MSVIRCLSFLVLCHPIFISHLHSSLGAENGKPDMAGLLVLIFSILCTFKPPPPPPPPRIFPPNYSFHFLSLHYSFSSLNASRYFPIWLDITFMIFRSRCLFVVVVFLIGFGQSRVYFSDVLDTEGFLTTTFFKIINSRSLICKTERKET